MLGWLISLALVESGVQRRSEARDILASWQAGLGGTDWIDELVARGDATFQSGNGYPTLHSTRFGAIRSLLDSGRPPAYLGIDVIGDDYFTPAGWVGSFKINHDLVALCADHEVVVIEVWDQS